MQCDKVGNYVSLSTHQRNKWPACVYLGTPVRRDGGWGRLAPVQQGAALAPACPLVPALKRNEAPDA